METPPSAQVEDARPPGWVDATEEALEYRRLIHRLAAGTLHLSNRDAWAVIVAELADTPAIVLGWQRQVSRRVWERRRALLAAAAQAEMSRARMRPPAKFTAPTPP
jgi:hypothetical protein